MGSRLVWCKHGDGDGGDDYDAGEGGDGEAVNERGEDYVGAGAFNSDVWGKRQLTLALWRGFGETRVRTIQVVRLLLFFSPRGFSPRAAFSFSIVFIYLFIYMFLKKFCEMRGKGDQSRYLIVISRIILRTFQSQKSNANYTNHLYHTPRFPVVN